MFHFAGGLLALLLGGVGGGRAHFVGRRRALLPSCSVSQLASRSVGAHRTTSFQAPCPSTGWLVMSKVSNASRKRAAKLGLLDTAGLVDPPVAGAAVHQSQRHAHASTTPHYAHAATQTDPSADVAWLFLQLSLAFGGGTAGGSPRSSFPPPPPAAATLPPASALSSGSSVDAPGALVDGSSGDGDGAGFEGSVRKLSVGAPLNDHCVSQDALLSSQPTNSAPPPGPYVPPPLRSRASACSPAAATTSALSTNYLLPCVCCTFWYGCW